MLRKFSRYTPAAMLAATLFTSQLALAHAVLVDSTPKPGDTVHGSSMQIELKFNSRVDGTGSTLQLATADGSVRTLPLGTQTSPSEINSQVDGLVKGGYTLRWQALASDGHISRGQIAFKVE